MIYFCNQEVLCHHSKNLIRKVNIMFDDTTHINNTSQMSLVIRHVEVIEIREDFESVIDRFWFHNNMIFWHLVFVLFHINFLKFFKIFTSRKYFQLIFDALFLVLFLHKYRKYPSKSWTGPLPDYHHWV